MENNAAQRRGRLWPGMAVRTAAVTLTLGGLIAPAIADDAAKAQKQDLQTASQNPVAALISVPFQNNFYFGGATDKPLYVLNIEPVVPLSFGDRWNLIARPILPVLSAPGLLPGQDRETGLGDLTVEAFFAPKIPITTEIGDIALGLGPAVTLPTHTDRRLGSRNYSAGPAFVAFVSKAPFTYGFLAVNQWSFAGPESEAETNELTLQPFINYNMKDGWSLQTAPVISVDWTKENDNVTLPVGGGVTKLTEIDGLPMKFSASAYYNALRPDTGSDWQLQAGVTFLFPE